MSAGRFARFSARSLAMLLAASTVAPLAYPAAATDSQAFYCIIPDESPPIQPFVVPQGISQLQVVVQGAHGGNPGSGADGGFGGLSQATFAVSPDGPLTPGQLLDVWVGCFGDDPQGYGFGGAKGRAPFPTAGDGGPGGGGSAIIVRSTQVPLLVAGGGGGGGGSSGGSGGVGGSGGSIPQPGQDGSGGGGADGGCGGCLGPGEINGLDGSNGDFAGGEGGGGGGGGGYAGGGGGHSGGYFGGGGGGGAGSSYAASSAQYVTLTTSQLAQNGTVVFSWGGTLREADQDGVPDRHDRCRRSSLTETVVLGRCDSHAGNDLDVSGCTITDRIVKIAKHSHGRREFLERVRRLGGALYLDEFITRPERRAIQRCAAKVNLANLRR